MLTARHTLRGAFVVIALLLAPALASADDGPRTRSAVDYALVPQAEVADAAECALSAAAEADEPAVDFGPGILNPAMTCPDSFAWYLFAKAVRERFWTRYGTDTTMLPAAPWPACPGGSGERCCAAIVPFDGALDGPAAHCPSDPSLAAASPVHAAGAPSKAHRQAPDVAWDEVDPIDRTMAIANETVEVVYRNRPMLDYVLAHDLYHREGLARVFARYAQNRLVNAPFAVDDEATPPAAAGVRPLTRIDFPVGALMLKANFLPVEDAAAVGIDIARDGPFVTVSLMPPDVSAGAAGEDHILLSLHISSKAIPNWFWATFEHVSNQGRCDLIGCNDSFGYRTAAPADFEGGALPDGEAVAARNFVPADSVTNAFGAGIDIFGFAGRYDGGERTDALAALFAAFGVAGGAAGEELSPADPAWGMYRLKGSLTEFVSSTGVPRIVGNSVTEAGFSQTSGCMSCHANAAVNATGDMAFAIFERDVSYLGFPLSVNGAPVPERFQVETKAVHSTGVSETLAVQTDFVWGFRFARPLATD